MCRFALQYWDAKLAAKLSMMKLKSSWVLCCAISPSNKFVCSGGLDNILTVCRVFFFGSDGCNFLMPCVPCTRQVFTNFEDEKEPAKPILELEDHSGEKAMQAIVGEIENVPHTLLVFSSFVLLLLWWWWCAGYLSCIRFTEGDTEVVTSSGDQKIIIWDLDKGVGIRQAGR